MTKIIGWAKICYTARGGGGRVAATEDIPRITLFLSLSLSFLLSFFLSFCSSSPYNINCFLLTFLSFFFFLVCVQIFGHANAFLPKRV